MFRKVNARHADAERLRHVRGPPAGLHSYTANLTTRRQYEAMTEAMDTEFGRLLGSIDRSNTVVIFVGDNGTPGEVGQPPFTRNRAKFRLAEGGIRVPMPIAGPVVQNPQRESTNLVHVVDLFATILELPGADLESVLPPRVPSDSRSLMPILTNGPVVPRDWVFSERFPAPCCVPGDYGRAIRDDGFTLTRLNNGFQGFYDLLADPYEATNLFGRTLTLDQTNHLNALRAKLAELQNVPQITGISRSSNRFSISVDYLQGLPFSLYRSDNLSSNSFKLISSLSQRTHFTVTLTDANATNAASYLRWTPSSNH